MLRDLRFAVRALRRSPAFAAATVGTLTLAALAGSVVLTLIYQVLLRPLPFPEPASLVRLFEENHHSQLYRQRMSPGTYRAVVTHSRSFNSLAAFATQDAVLRFGSSLRSVRITSVTESFFSVLGTPAEMGSMLRSDRAAQPGNSELVISYGLWRSWFGGRRDILGEVVWLEGRKPFTIVGVMPTRGIFPENTDAWRKEVLPDQIGPAFRSIRSYGVIARLRDGATRQSAQADLAGIARDLEREYPISNRGWHVTLERLDESILRSLRSRLAILAATTAGFLLISICNVFYLCAARFAARRDEIAIRYALGATPSRLRQFVGTEMLLLCGAASLSAAALGWWLFRVVVPLIPESVRILQNVHYGWSGLLLAIATPGSVGLLLSALLVVVRVDHSRAWLHGRAVLSTRGTRSRTLVAGQCAMTVVLLTCTILLASTFWRLSRADLGFEASRALSIDIRVPRGAVIESRPWFELQQLFDGLIGELTSVPGMDFAGAVAHLPLSLDTQSGLVWLSSAPGAAPDVRLPAAQFQWTADINLVAPDYFRALSIRLARGRWFDDGDRFTEPQLLGRSSLRPIGAAIVNSTFARTYFHERDPLGQSLVILDAENFARSWTVVGVVDDTAYRASASDARPTVFLPLFQVPTAFHLQLVGGSRANGRLLASECLRRLRNSYPNLLISRAQPVKEIVAASHATTKLLTELMAMSAIMALLLALSGVYGLVALTLQDRTIEAALKVALGGSIRRTIAEITVQALAPVGIGATAGSALTPIVWWAMRSLLFEAGARDMVTLAAAPLVLCGAAACAAVPSFARALMIDPAVLLRVGT